MTVQAIPLLMTVEAALLPQRDRDFRMLCQPAARVGHGNPMTAITALSLMALKATGRIDFRALTVRALPVGSMRQDYLVTALAIHLRMAERTGGETGSSVSFLAGSMYLPQPSWGLLNVRRLSSVTGVTRIARRFLVVARRTLVQDEKSRLIMNGVTALAGFALDEIRMPDENAACRERTCDPRGVAGETSLLVDGRERQLGAHDPRHAHP